MSRAALRQSVGSLAVDDRQLPAVQGVAVHSSLPEVVMYSLSGCPYCFRARRRLRRKDVAYQEIRFSLRERRAGRVVLAQLGGATFPQILIAGTRLGGNAKLVRADRSGELDQLLNRSSDAM
jgi:glutaredoxin 3